MNCPRMIIKIAMRGKGTGAENAGGASECICPKCGYIEAHSFGDPCNTKKCPECGTAMTGKGAPGEVKVALSSKLYQRASEKALSLTRDPKMLLKKFESLGKSHSLNRHLLDQVERRMSQFKRFSNPNRIPSDIRKIYKQYGLPDRF